MHKGKPSTCCMHCSVPNIFTLTNDLNIRGSNDNATKHPLSRRRYKEHHNLKLDKINAHTIYSIPHHSISILGTILDIKMSCVEMINVETFIS